MLPVTTIEVTRGVDFETLWVPDEEARDDGFTDNCEYEPIGAVSWNQVVEVSELEVEVFAELATTVTDADAFEAALAELEYENAPYWDLGGLELGVAAAVLALSAVGCVTCFSCRGHGGSSYPQIRLAADARLARVVDQCTLPSGCVVESDGEGLLWVCAPSLVEMFAFADELIALRNEFAPH